MGSARKRSAKKSSSRSASAKKSGAKKRRQSPIARVKRVGVAVMHQAGGAAEAVKETIGNVYENIQERF